MKVSNRSQRQTHSADITISHLLKHVSRHAETRNLLDSGSTSPLSAAQCLSGAIPHSALRAKVPKKRAWAEPPFALRSDWNEPASCIGQSRPSAAAQLVRGTARNQEKLGGLVYTAKGKTATDEAVPGFVRLARQLWLCYGVPWGAPLGASRLWESKPSAAGTRDRPLPDKHSLRVRSIKYMGPVRMNKTPGEFVRNHYPNPKPVEQDENSVSVQQTPETRDSFKHASGPIKATFYWRSHACEKVYLGHRAKEGRKAVRLSGEGKLIQCIYTEPERFSWKAFWVETNELLGLSGSEGRSTAPAL